MKYNVDSRTYEGGYHVYDNEKPVGVEWTTYTAAVAWAVRGCWTVRETDRAQLDAAARGRRDRPRIAQASPPSAEELLEKAKVLIDRIFLEIGYLSEYDEIPGDWQALRAELDDERRRAK